MPGEPPLRTTPAIPGFGPGRPDGSADELGAQVQCKCLKIGHSYQFNPLDSVFSGGGFPLSVPLTLSFCLPLATGPLLVFREKHGLSLCRGDLGLVLRTKRSISLLSGVFRTRLTGLGQAAKFLGLSALLSAAQTHAEFPP